LTANASDNVGIASVPFEVNKHNAGPALADAPYSYSWDSTGVADGPYSIGAIAKDAAGNTAKTAINIIVKNKDTTPPIISIVSPSMGATLLGTAVILADASDNVGIATVQFQIDGANAGAPLTAAPYSYSWNSTNASNGPHILGAIAK